MIRQVLIYPNNILKTPAEEVGVFSERVHSVIADLRETMYASGHSVGIAAPQIGELLRILTVNAGLSRKPCENHGELVLINPEIVSYDGFAQGREGCMSVPEYTGLVTRAQKVMVSYTDEDQNRRTIEAQGFEAIVLQHEIDHLDGVLFIDRVISRKRDLFLRK